MGETYPTVDEWGPKQLLAFEKESLGFYLSGHMFDSYAVEARRFARTKLSELEPSREPRMMWMTSLWPRVVSRPRTKTGRRSSWGRHG